MACLEVVVDLKQLLLLDELMGETAVAHEGRVNIGLVHPQAESVSGVVVRVPSNIPLDLVDFAHIAGGLRIGEHLDHHDGVPKTGLPESAPSGRPQRFPALSNHRTSILGHQLFSRMATAALSRAARPGRSMGSTGIRQYASTTSFGKFHEPVRLGALTLAGFAGLA
jgi:hypothetical protein